MQNPSGQSYYNKNDDIKMANQGHPSGFGVSGTNGDEQESNASPERARLYETLVKSPQWKKNTFREIDSTESTGNTDAVADPPEGQSKERMLVQMTTQLEKRNEEIERMRSKISRLSAEKAKLTIEFQIELDEHKAELASLQEAYDQFEALSDDLLNELDEQNERLRAECKTQNPRSVL